MNQLVRTSRTELRETDRVATFSGGQIQGPAAAQTAELIGFGPADQSNSDSAYRSS